MCVSFSLHQCACAQGSCREEGGFAGNLCRPGQREFGSRIQGWAEMTKSLGLQPLDALRSSVERWLNHLYQFGHLLFVFKAMVSLNDPGFVCGYQADFELEVILQ